MPEKSFLERTRFVLTVLGGLYAAAIGLLAVPFFQSHVLYLNALRFPFFAKFDTPEKYGLSRAWFILSDQYYQALPQIPFNLDDHVYSAVERHPTILFFHGNAATRAFSARVMHYEAYSSRLGANVLAIDYRGYADSTGTPSEQGLVTDARAAWDWLIQRGAKEDDILLVGHSLGTGVVSQLAAELSDEGLRPRGIVLLSPFSSIREVLNTYQFFGLIPLMKPLAMVPYVPSKVIVRYACTGMLTLFIREDLITKALIHRFDSLGAVPRIQAPVLIAHAEDDWDIPHTHSVVLFDAFLKPYLPPLDLPEGLSVTQESWEKFWAQREAWTAKRTELLTITKLPNFGIVEQFEADGRKVVFVKTLAGGHDYLGVQEGVQDFIRTSFNVHRLTA
ncbi:hypothetical protein H0H87_006278 [Tephrocybe sp. NHM501043]|nr:hypothetical protein H0H87_006278 [Tephrocybe sp. NHM501043]